MRKTGLTGAVAGGARGPYGAAMRRHLRHPLALLVAAECCAVLAFGAAAWHLLQAHGMPIGGLQIPRIGAAADPPAPVPSLQPTPPAVAAASRPGLSLDPAFLSSHLRSIDADQAALQAAEWRLMRSITAAARGYLERVVLPAVERAERRPADQAPGAASP